MIHLYTHNDLDGVGCGILAKIAYGEQCQVSYNSVARLNAQVERYFDEIKNKQPKEDMLMITDLSVNEANSKRIDKLVSRQGRAKFIDHHKTALHLNGFSWAEVVVQDEDGRLTSATSLFYNYLQKEGVLKHSATLDEFVDLIRQYDTWEWEKNENVKAKKLNDLFSLLSLDEFEKQMIERLTKEEAFEFNEFEQRLLVMEEEKINRYIRRKNRELIQTFIGDHCVGIVHAESYHSELGNELGKENRHCDYIVIVNMGGKKVSFRTIHDEIDVSQIAQSYGGGGHAKASGCTLNEEAYKVFVDDVFALEPSRFDAPKNTVNLKENPTGSLYENHLREKWLIKQQQNDWVVEHGGKQLPLNFPSFAEGERFVKRQYAAALAKDDSYKEFIKNIAKK